MALMETDNPSPYALLASRLDNLPNGFPPAPDGSHLRLLAKLFTPEEARLAAQLRMTLETPVQIASRVGGDPAALRKQLKDMSRHGLVSAGEAEEGGLGFGLLPFVVGIYEFQSDRMDAELARLFEEYFLSAFGKMLTIQPHVHRVIPVNESIPLGLEVRPYESIAALIAGCQSWGVNECICRKQKALIGQACGHPIDNCMVLSTRPNAFDNASWVRALSQEEAMAVLHQAAEAGLVHTISNRQKDVWYICNCCTCSCGILRGMADLGLASVVAHSAYLNSIDQDRCNQCGACVDRCQFTALILEEQLRLDELRCAGCGVCILACPEGALQLKLRPAEDILIPPETESEWQESRARERQIDLSQVQ